MTEEHLTTVRAVGEQIQACCAEHGPVGLRQYVTTQGWNAVSVEARGHDDIAHGIYRTYTTWRASALAAKETP